jgi:NTE family protein
MNRIADKPIERALVLAAGGGRGAYQVGVCQFLEEKSWHPDMVLGTSIGATNGAILVAPRPNQNMSGVELLQQVWLSEMTNKALHQASHEWPFISRWIMDLVIQVLQALQEPRKTAEADELFPKLIEKLSVEWKDVEQEKVSLMGVIQKMIGKPSLMDREGWRKLLDQYVSFDQLNASEVYFCVAVTDVLTGAPQYLWNRKPEDAEGIQTEISVEHVMASSSIPGIYPATPLGKSEKREWWDGVCVANAPIGPAIDAGAKEIIVVLMTPWHPKPHGKGVPLRSGVSSTVLDASDRYMEWMMLASLRSELKRKKKDQKVQIVAPRKIQSIVQIIDYNPEETETLIRQGYNDAEDKLQLPG